MSEHTRSAVADTERPPPFEHADPAVAVLDDFESIPDERIDYRLTERGELACDLGWAR